MDELNEEADRIAASRNAEVVHAFLHFSPPADVAERYNTAEAEFRIPLDPQQMRIQETEREPYIYEEYQYESTDDWCRGLGCYG